ncbi:MAG: hypothetical protein ACXAC7_06565, partial [Candidatus Hodarchaeales archaeon]
MGESKKRTMSDLYISKRLFPYLLVRKKLVFITFFLIIFSTFIDLTAPYLVSLMIDDYVLLGRKNGILLIGVFYFVILVIGSISIFFRGWL